jgi:hypothetical protein
MAGKQAIKVILSHLMDKARPVQVLRLPPGRGAAFS